MQKATALSLRRLRIATGSMIKSLLPLAFVCFGCYQPTHAEAGAFIDSEYGLFEVTLEFNDEDSAYTVTADELAETAAVSLHTVVELELYNYEEIEKAVPCVNDALIRVATKETYFSYCPEISIACNHSNNTIYLTDEVSYSCTNEYTPGHEFLHSIFRCLGKDEHKDHSTENVFAWENFEGQPFKNWNVNSAEHQIKMKTQYCEQNH